MVGPAAPYFLAVDLDDEARHALAGRLDVAFRDHRLPGVTTSPENWHVTLRWFGPTPIDRVEVLTHRLSDAWIGSSFRLQLDGLGAFPKPVSASVLWVGTGEGTEELVLARERLEDVAEEAGHGREDRPFVPHLTLSRIRPPREVWPWLEQDPELNVWTRVEAITLFRTHVRPTWYETIERFSLG